ncbi:MULTISPECIES: hypothetical protein [Trueperella]|uniref:Uncharacterized protein n=1 Tax=Trueperella abortisuis TaxID=445930 RepID=A0ABT9PJW1_9ACTO|nr:MULTISPECIES: hypothetical protein [Trueperella]MCI7306160.1 hypothetical protein [Trueperella sp.]MDP9833004.1 hypothetical protein [Trueperella abortisuis]MDY5404400.1 hypothetical protein [Trueperella sp.]
MTDVKRSRNFGLSFEGFSLEKVQEILESYPGTTPTDYFDDGPGPFPILACYSTDTPPEVLQQFVKDRLNYRPPADEQFETLPDLESVRAFTRS